MTASALADRAALNNDELTEGAAKELADASVHEPAGRNRCRGLSIGPMSSQENSAGTNQFGSADLAASSSILLRRDAKEADLRAAAASLRTAEARVGALKLRAAGEVAGLVADYRATSKALATMRHISLPDAEVALTAERRTPNLSDAFPPSQRTPRIRLDIPKLATEQQAAIAEIEKTSGGVL